MKNKAIRHEIERFLKLIGGLCEDQEVIQTAQPRPIQPTCAGFPASTMTGTVRLPSVS